MAPWGMGAEGPGSVPEHPMGRNESRRDAEGGGDGSSAGGFFGKGPLGSAAVLLFKPDA